MLTEKNSGNSVHTKIIIVKMKKMRENNSIKKIIALHVIPR